MHTQALHTLGRKVGGMGTWRGEREERRWQRQVEEINNKGERGEGSSCDMPT